MLEYFVLDWREFDLPVYPIAVLSHREIDQASLPPLRMSIQDCPILDFHFAVIDLARLDASHYVRELNAAAMPLSSRMRVDPAARISLAVDFVSNTVPANWTPKEQDVVYRFFFTYQEFTDEEALKLEKKMSSIKGMWTPPKFLRKHPLVRLGMTEGRQAGRREGRQEGEIDLVLRLLNRRLGPVSPRQQQAIRKLPLARIEDLGEALLDFQTAIDLRRWLKSHSQ